MVNSTTPPASTTTGDGAFFNGVGSMLKGFDVIDGQWANSISERLDLFDTTKFPQKDVMMGGVKYTVPTFLTIQTLVEDYSHTTVSNSAKEFSQSLSQSISAKGSYDGFSGSVDLYFSQTVRSSSSYTAACAHNVVYHATITYDGTPLSEMRQYLLPDAQAAIDGTGPDPMSPEELINKYGSHILTGGVFGGRADISASTLTANTSISTTMSAKLSMSYDIIQGATSTTTDIQSNDEFTSECDVKVFVWGGDAPASAGTGKPFLTGANYKSWAHKCRTTHPVLISFTAPGTEPLTPIWGLCADPARAAAIEAQFESMIGANVYSDGVEFVGVSEYVRTQVEPGSSHARYQQICLTVNPNFLDEASGGNWQISPQTEFTEPFYVATSAPSESSSGSSSGELVPVKCLVLNGNPDGTGKPDGEGILFYTIGLPEDLTDKFEYGVGAPVALPNTTGNVAFYAFNKHAPGTKPVYQFALDREVYVDGQPPMSVYRYSMSPSLPMYHLSDYQIVDPSLKKSCIAFYAYPVIGA